MGEQPPTRTRSAPVLHHRRHAPAPVVRVTLLDAFVVTEDGIERGLSAAAQRLVALVALHGRPVRRDYAATTLWPHLDARIAGASLRSTLSRIRSASPYLMLAGSGDLGLADGVCVDVYEFDDAASHLIDDASAKQEGQRTESAARRFRLSHANGHAYVRDLVMTAWT